MPPVKPMWPIFQDTILTVDSSAVEVSDTTSLASDAMMATSQLLGVDVTTMVQLLIKSVLFVFLTWLAIRALKVLTKRMLAGFESPTGSTVSDMEQRMITLVQLLNSVGSIIITLAGALSVLNLFLNIGPLIAGIGVLGLAVSFGAQSLVKDVISGFFILFENQYDIGDVVEINGVSGAVEAMTLRIVRLRDIDGVVHIIPNGSISKVTNKTSGWSRVVFDIGVAYHEKVDHVLGVIKSILDEFWKDPKWSSDLLKEPEVLGVQELGDSSVVSRVVLQTKPGKQWQIKRELRRRVKNRFDEEGIEIPFPQRTVHVREKTGGA